MRRVPTFLLLAASALIITSDGAVAGEKKTKTPPQELKFSGTVIRETGEKKGKDGKSYSYTAFYLDAEEGKIHLPQGKLKGKDGTSTGAIDLSQFVGQKVSVKATGWMHYDKKKDSKSFAIHKLVSVERIAQR